MPAVGTVVNPVGSLGGLVLALITAGVPLQQKPGRWAQTQSVPPRVATKLAACGLTRTRIAHRPVDRPKNALPRLEGVLGLPDSVRGCLFDLDGVLTKTA